MSSIHPSSCISPKAHVANDVEIGPFCVVEAEAVIGEGTVIESHAVVRFGTHMGRENYLAEGVVLGGLPQHKQQPAQSGQLFIGDRNIFRENVTVHRGLGKDDRTEIGDDNLLMVNSHVAHDCHLGNHTIIANNVMLAGHVTVGNSAYLSGAVGVHQFCRVGAFTMLGGQARITKDVPPFVTVDGDSNLIVGLNLVGLRRGGFDRTQIQELKAIYRVAFRSGLRWEDVIESLRKQFPTSLGQDMADFMEATKRGCIQERRVPKQATIRLHLPESKSADDKQQKRASA